MEWISVNDQLPDDEGKKYGKEVLCFIVTQYDGVKGKRYSTRIMPFKDGIFYSQYVCNANAMPRFGQTVTHWADLPKRPKN